ISEEPRVAGVVVGKTNDGALYKNQNIDFFDVKGDLEILLDRLAVGTMRLESHAHCALHPGQSAVIVIDDRPVGWLGRLDPKLSNELGIEGSVFLFEIQQAALETRTSNSFVAASKFPAVKRDLAFVVPEKVTAEDMIFTFQQQGDTILRKVQIFDVFRGGHIATGSKSVAFSLLFQSMEKTLEEAEINQQVALLISAVQNKFGAQLRDK
ncbi:MAG: phenylalanine--tRNA ligase subunit beta, partial [Pseudomonadota bacterium]